jgi:hypothetical protein
MKTIRIPSHWSPQQALEVLDLLQSLSDAIWETYQQPLTALLAQQARQPEDESPREDGFPFDDDIPF